MPPHDLLVLFPPLGVSPFSNHTNSTQSCGEGWMGLFFKSCTLSELDVGLVQFFFISYLFLFFFWFIDGASIGMSMFHFDGQYQCSYLLVYYYPCVFQFLTTQKEGQNGMSSDSSMFVYDLS